MGLVCAQTSQKSWLNIADDSVRLGLFLVLFDQHFTLFLLIPVLHTSFIPRSHGTCRTSGCPGCPHKRRRNRGPCSERVGNRAVKQRQGEDGAGAKKPSWTCGSAEVRI